MERGSRRSPRPTSCWLKVNLGLSGKRDFIYICRECQPASPDCSGLMMSPGAQVPRDVSLACFLRHENESGTGQQRPPTPPGRGRSPGPGGHTGARASSSAPPAAAAPARASSSEQQKPGPRGGIQPGAWGQRARPPAAGPGPCLCPVLHSPRGHGAAHPRAPRLRNRGRGECGRSARPRRRPGTGEEGAHDSQTTRAAQAVAQAAEVPRPRPRS